MFNLELPATEINQRILSAEARIRLGDMRGGRMNSDDDWTRLARRMSELAEAPLWLNSTPAASVEAVAAEATELCAQHPMGLIAVDSPASLTASVEAGASRERELSTAVRRVKTLARELDVPVVVTAELGRSVDNRADRRPALSDLRESDTIHQVADNIILIHRPDAVERDDPRMGEADLILAKHRQGPPTTVTVAHQLHYSRFVDMAKE
ncbi:replicative DNA helicase [Saccharopolyspora lacisalsi]|uniref:Replicative DNA helicase n=1 Tax=Halosaccharopolyspora lacisalsi TaxID=1000566 RepID=A0A839DQY2_9PSEU|nr:replicative DNA helicase [Halosaccharopolyspora lacisalsi]